MADILLENITKAYGDKQVLRGISLDIKDGELVSLVGPSGGGKTTTLRVLAGLTDPDSGRVIAGGRDITSLPAEQRRIVMVFQDALLFPHLTVGDNITFGLRMAGKSKSFQRARMRELLDTIEMPGYDKHFPAQLSGGQQKRVALARALALEPEILLLDEPLSNLDPRLREEMRSLIAGLRKRFNMTMVLVTHDQDEAMMMADRIAVLNNGVVSQYDAPVVLYSRPANAEVAGIFGPCNVLPGEVEGRAFSSCGCRWNIPQAWPQGAGEAYVRAEHIEITNQSPEFIGRVCEVQYASGYSLLKVRAGDTVLMVRAAGYWGQASGQAVGLKVDWSRAHFRVTEEAERKQQEGERYAV